MPISELTPEQQLKLLTLVCMAPLVARTSTATVANCCGSTIGNSSNHRGTERSASTNGFVFSVYHGEDIKEEVPARRDSLLIPDTAQNIVVDWVPA